MEEVLMRSAEAESVCKIYAEEDGNADKISMSCITIQGEESVQYRGVSTTFLLSIAEDIEAMERTATRQEALGRTCATEIRQALYSYDVDMSSMEIGVTKNEAGMIRVYISIINRIDRKSGYFVFTKGNATEFANDLRLFAERLTVIYGAAACNGK